MNSYNLSPFFAIYALFLLFSSLVQRLIMRGMRNEIIYRILHIKINITYHDVLTQYLKPFLWHFIFPRSSSSSFLFSVETFWVFMYLKQITFEGWNVLRELCFSPSLLTMKQEMKHHGTNHLTINYKYIASRWIVSARWSNFLLWKRTFSRYSSRSCSCFYHVFRFDSTGWWLRLS